MVARFCAIEAEIVASSVKFRHGRESISERRTYATSISFRVLHPITQSAEEELEAEGELVLQ